MQNNTARLNIPVGNFEKFSSGFMYAEALTYEDGQGFELDYVETSDGPFIVSDSGQVTTASNEEVQEPVSGPVNNSFWVLSEDHDQFISRDDFVADAAKLKNLNVALIDADGRFGLALTGGGMDLSWQMAAAHVRLGYYPPSELVLNSLQYGVSQLGEEEAIVVADARLADMERRQRILEGDIEYLSTQLHQLDSRVK